MTLVYSKELDFIPKLQLSKSRRAVYYEYGDRLKLPKKFLKKEIEFKKLKDTFIFKMDTKTSIMKLFNITDDCFVIKNSRSVGTPRYFIINGQDLYSGKFEREQRAGLILKLHQYFLELFGKNIYENSHLWINSSLKIQMTWYVKEDYKGPDLDNLWIFEKVLLDMMVKDLKVIPDDNHKIIKELVKKYEYRETEGFKIEIYKI